MPQIKIQLTDHITTQGTVSREGRACRSECSYFTGPPLVSIPNCTLFLTSLGTAPGLGSGYEACKACLGTIRSEFEEAQQNRSVSIVVQRNLESPVPLALTTTRLQNYEVEMNTVLRGYNEFRLTLTQLEPRESYRVSDRPEAERPTIVAPIVLDIGPDGTDGADS